MAKRGGGGMKASRTVLGRRVVYNSPARHPQQKDPLGRQVNLDWTEGGPGGGDAGSESYNAANKRRTRLANLGKRGWRPAEYGS